MNCLKQTDGRSAVEHAVMEAMIRFSRGHATCCPSLAELSDVAGFSRRAICLAVKALRNRRILVVSHRFAGDGRQLSNEYRLKADTRDGAM